MKIKIGVFFGGNSVEHEVSIITAIQAIENIDKSKYEIIPIYISKSNKMYCGKNIGNIESYKDIKNLIKNSYQITLTQLNNSVGLLKVNNHLFSKKFYNYIDIAFPIVHGTNVEDGTLQGFLKMFNLPFIGCDILASSCGMDKYICKIILKNANIPVLDSKEYFINTYENNLEDMKKEIINTFNYPVIIKPVNLGSSVGIHIAKNDEELNYALNEAFTFSHKILIERAIMNLKEVNCSVLGDYENAITSECEEPTKTDEILSYKDKYISGNSKKTTSMNAGVLKLPADITKEQKDEISSLAIKTFNALNAAGVIRIDFMIDQDSNKIYVNEVNTIPGSLSFHLWKATNLSYQELLDKLIDLSLKRFRENQNLTFSFDTNILSNLNNSNLKSSKLK